MSTLYEQSNESTSLLSYHCESVPNDGYSLRNNISMMSSSDSQAHYEGGDDVSAALSSEVDYEQSNMVLNFEQALKRTAGPKDSNGRYLF